MKLKHWLESFGRGVSKRVKNSTQQQTTSSTNSSSRGTGSSVYSSTATPTFRNNFLNSQQVDHDEDEQNNSEEEEQYVCQSDLLAGSSAANFRSFQSQKNQISDKNMQRSDAAGTLIPTAKSDDVINSNNNEFRRRGSLRPSATTQVVAVPPEQRNLNTTTAQRGNHSIKQCASFSTSRGSSSWLQQRNLAHNTHQEQQRPSATQLQETINNQILRRESHRQLLITNCGGNSGNSKNMRSSLEQHSTPTKNSFSHHMGNGNRQAAAEKLSERSSEASQQHLSRRQKSELTTSVEQRQPLSSLYVNKNSGQQNSGSNNDGMSPSYTGVFGHHPDHADSAAFHSSCSNTPSHNNCTLAKFPDDTLFSRSSLSTSVQHPDSRLYRQISCRESKQIEKPADRSSSNRRSKICTNPWLRTTSAHSRNESTRSNTTAECNLALKTSSIRQSSQRNSKPELSSLFSRETTVPRKNDDCTTICSCDSLCSIANSNNSSNSSSSATSTPVPQTHRSRAEIQQRQSDNTNHTQVSKATKNDSRSSSRASSTATSSNNSTHCSTTASSSDHESWTFSANIPSHVRVPNSSLPPNYPPPSLPPMIAPPQSPSSSSSSSSFSSNNQLAHAVVRQIERVFANSSSKDDAAAVSDNTTTPTGRNRRLRTRAARAADSIFVKRNNTGSSNGGGGKATPIYAEPRPALINVGSLYSESRDARKPRTAYETHIASNQPQLLNPYASAQVAISNQRSPVYATPTTTTTKQLPNHHLLMAASCSTTRVSPSDSGRFSAAPANSSVLSSVRKCFGRDTIERFETDSGHGSKTLSSLESPSSLTDAATASSHTTTPQDVENSCLLHIAEAFDAFPMNHSSTIDKFNFEHHRKNNNAVGLIPFFDDDQTESAYYQSNTATVQEEEDREHLMQTQLDQLRFKRLLLEEELNGMGYSVPSIVPPPPPRRTTSRITTSTDGDVWRGNGSTNSFHDSMRQQQQEQRNLIHSLAQLKHQMQVQDVRLSDGLSQCKAAAAAAVGVHQNNWSPPTQYSSTHHSRNQNNITASLWDEEYDEIAQEDGDDDSAAVAFAQHLRSYSDSDAQPKFHDAASMLSTRSTSARWSGAGTDENGIDLKRDVAEQFNSENHFENGLYDNHYHGQRRYSNGRGNITYEMVANTKESIC